jgi:tetratricopeptide (TPR) repeat protein
MPGLDDAHALRESGRLADAREAYAAVFLQGEAGQHDRGAALVWLGELMRQQGDTALARDVLESLPLVPGSAEEDSARATEILKSISGLPKPRSEAWEPTQTAGYQALARGDRASARTVFEKALSLAWNRSQKALSRNQLAMLLQDSRSFWQCRALLRLSLADGQAKEDARADAQYILAHSYINEGNWPDARKQWAVVLDMNGAWPEARSEAALIVGQGLVEEGQFSRGREILQRCLDNPKGERWHKWDSLVSIAHSFRGEGKGEEAARTWERLLAEPGLDDGRRERAMEYLRSLR